MNFQTLLQVASIISRGEGHPSLSGRPPSLLPGIVSRGEGLPAVPARPPSTHNRIVSGRTSLGSPPAPPNPVSPAGEACPSATAPAQLPKLAPSPPARWGSGQLQGRGSGEMPPGGTAKKPLPVCLGSASPQTKAREASGGSTFGGQDQPLLPGQSRVPNGASTPTSKPQESKTGQQMLRMIQQGTLRLPSTVPQQSVRKGGSIALVDRLGLVMFFFVLCF